MFTSKFSKSQKQEIVNERIQEGMSVSDICKKYGITVQTFYQWQKKLSVDPEDGDAENQLKEESYNSPEAENRMLRRLYIDLSEHNYKLAKFLNK